MRITFSANLFLLKPQNPFRIPTDSCQKSRRMWVFIQILVVYATNILPLIIRINLV